MDVPIFSDTRAHQGVTLLVVRPHPDDESIATGGMLASYSTRGVRTGVVICTGGEEGAIHDPDLDPVADRPRLHAIRAQEVRDACTILGGGLYAHPDHIMCSRVSVDAFHAAGYAHAYPEAGPPWRVAKLYAIAQIDDGQWGALLPEFKVAGVDTAFLERQRHHARRPGPETATVALDVRPYSELQRQALRAHRTQISRESFLVNLPVDLRRRAFATAYFLRLFPPTAPGEHELDLLAGLDGTARIG